MQVVAKRTRVSLPTCSEVAFALRSPPHLDLTSFGFAQSLVHRIALRATSRALYAPSSRLSMAVGPTLAVTATGVALADRPLDAILFDMRSK